MSSWISFLSATDTDPAFHENNESVVEQVKVKHQAFKMLFIVFFALSSVNFFEPAFLSESISFYSYFLCFGVTMAMVVANIKYVNDNVYLRPIWLILLALFLSCFSATFSWNQSLSHSVKAIIPYTSYSLFLVLVVWQATPHLVEKIIIILGITFILVYFITFFIYPVHVFGNIQKYSNERGFQRILINGIGFVFLFTFYAMSQYATLGKKKWLYIYGLCMICIVMTLTRTYIASAVIFSLIFLLKNSNILKKFIVVVIASSAFFLVSQMEFYQNLTKETKEQTEDLESDIRVQAALYFLNDFSPNDFARIFGNGEPYYQGSDYIKYVQKIEGQLGIYSADVGYIGLYSKFGVLAILGYILLFIQTVRLKLPEEYMYLKYYLYFIFIISIIISAPFNNDFIPSIVIVLYLASSVRHDVKMESDLSLSKVDL